MASPNRLSKELEDAIPDVQSRADRKKTTTSFPDSVAKSASGLFRDTFSTNGNQAATSLSQALAHAEKGESSLTTASSAASSLQQAGVEVRPSSSKPAIIGLESFRSARTSSPFKGFEGTTLDQFMQSGTNDADLLLGDEVNTSWKNQSEYADELSSSKGKQAVYADGISDVAKDNYDLHYAEVLRRTLSSGSIDEEKGNPRPDGHAVIEMLTSPTFHPGHWLEGEWHDAKPFAVSDEDAKLARRFVQETQGVGPQQARLARAVNAAKENRSFKHFASIFDEIEYYQDDVWGYGRPLIQAAREEQQAVTDPSADDGPAVRRLRMFLAHLDVPAA